MNKVGRPAKNLVYGRARYGLYQHYCRICNKKISRASISGRCQSCAQIGIKRKYTEESRRRASESKMGSKNPNWKGKKIGYWGVHSFVKRKFKRPKKCEICGVTENLDWANKNGKYLRNREDWICLCRSCHMKYDYSKGMRTWSRN